MTDRYQRINLNGAIKTKPTLPCSLIELRFNGDYEMAPKGKASVWLKIERFFRQDRI
jgi:hypothetical protein